MPALLPTHMLPVRGLRLRYHVQGRGDDVVLLHGIPDTLQGWNGRVQALARHFRVHAFDWPGLGASDAPAGFDYSFTGFARFLEDFLDAVGIGAAHLVGTDIGLPPALLLAMERPARVRSLVLMDGPVFERRRLFSPEVLAARTPILGELMACGFPRSMTWLVLQRGFYGEPRTTADQYEDFQAQARRPECRRVILELLRSAPESLTRLERGIRALRQPMLVLWGEDDVYNRVETAMLLKAACPHATLEVVPQCGHFLPMEVPQYFDEQVSAFLRQATPTIDWSTR